MNTNCRAKTQLPLWRTPLLTVLTVVVLLCTSIESAWAAISFQTAATNQNGAAISLTINKPTGVAVGDILLAQITFEKGSDAGSDAQITPANWTLIRRTNRSTDIGQAVFYKVATATDVSATSYTWTFGQSVKAAGGILRYTGVDTASPIVTSTGNSGETNPLTATGVTAQANSVVVALFGVKKNTSLSTPTGMTNPPRYSLSSSQDVTILATDQTVVAGGTGNKTSNAGSVDKWIAQLVELRVATASAPEISVHGNNVEIASGDTTPSATDHTDFGSIDVSSGTVLRTFTINNSGNAALSLSGSPPVVVSGANASDFVVTGNPASSVAAGGNTTFQISFDPSAAGVRTAAVTIANNDSDENPYTFAIRGYGIDRLLPTTQLIQQSASQSCSTGTTPYVRNCTVTFTLLNSSGGPLQINYYQITSISNHVWVLNGTPNPGQVGTVVSNVRSGIAGSTFQPQFNLGLTAKASYSIRFNVYGYPSGVMAASADAGQEVKLGEFEAILTLDETDNPYRILLPIVQR